MKWLFKWNPNLRQLVGVIVVIVVLWDPDAYHLVGVALIVLLILALDRLLRRRGDQ